jgi:hypothetical protein
LYWKQEQSGGAATSWVNKEVEEAEDEEILERELSNELDEGDGEGMMVEDAAEDDTSQP